MKNKPPKCIGKYFDEVSRRQREAWLRYIGSNEDIEFRIHGKTFHFIMDSGNDNEVTKCDP